jgi:peptide/nickel transport system substrate-binding protein
MTVARVRAATIALLLAGALPGCSGGGGDDAGAMTVGSLQPDFLDPALGTAIASSAPLSQVYLPLVTYRREEGPRGLELIPGLAEDLPRISPDGTTYTLRLREGLVYSDGSRVKASDFEHAIRRVLHLKSGATSFYTHIAGVAAYQEAGEAEGDIAGIEADDRTRRITIRLDQAYAPFEYVLALPSATPVPADTPFRNLTTHPPPSTGQFAIARSEPNREYVLERNSRFASNGIEGVPPAKLDRITTKIVEDKVKQAEDVLSGRLDYMLDAPPPELLPTVRKEAHDRYEENPTANTNWFFLNASIPPFDDPLVRRAVAYAVDKPGLRRLYAGLIEPGCSFLPRDMPGYDRRLDTGDCPFGDPARPPDVPRARRLIRAAGAGGAEVTVWGFNEWPAAEPTQAYAGMLDRIGLDARPRLVAQAAWRQTIGNEKTKAQTGYFGWTQTFPHPLNFFEFVDGDAIQPTNSKNTAHVDDPHINAELDRLAAEQRTGAVRGDWADLNRYLVEKAYVVPFGHRTRGTFVSERIDFEHCTEFHPVYLEDWSKFCLKEGEG